MNFRRLLEETAPVCVAGSEKQEIPCDPLTPIRLGWTHEKCRDRQFLRRMPEVPAELRMVEVPTIDHPADPEAGCCRQEYDGILDPSAAPVSSSSRSALETLEVLFSIVIAVAVGILITRKFHDPMLGLIGLAVAFAIIEAFFAPALALTSIGLAVLAFFIYVISKTDMIALAPQSREERLKNRDQFRRSHAPVEVE
jgi:hypothetical protein